MRSAAAPWPSQRAASHLRPPTAPAARCAVGSSPGIGASAAVSMPSMKATTSRSSSWRAGGVAQSLQRLLDGSALRYGRVVVMAQKASATARMRPMSGISSPSSPRGSRRPSQRSWWWRMPARTSSTFGHVAHDRVAQRDVLLEHRVLVGGQLRRLAQDDVRDADLADVVEQAGEVDRVAGLLVEAQPLGQEDGVARHVLGVALGVAVLGVDRDDQALQDVEAAGRRPAPPRRCGATHTRSPPLAFASPTATAAAEGARSPSCAWSG